MPPHGLAGRGVGVRSGRAEGQFRFIRPKRDGHHRFLPRLPVQPIQRMANRLGWELEMSERRITQLFGLGLGAIITCTMVLNAFAF
jgi:surfactin synthase thioesterase subunit